jgi:hypothetical protein|tara:strand:- start:1954 stop:2535 length:582 start_codon:yes stop_codon:yes gene_type:complete
LKVGNVRVLTLTGQYLPGYKGGGPIKTIKNLFDQAGDEITFKLITSDRDLGDTAPYTSVICGAWNQVGNASVFYAQAGKTGYAQITRQLRTKDYDIVYLNSFFSQIEPPGSIGYVDLFLMEERWFCQEYNIVWKWFLFWLNIVYDGAGLNMLTFTDHYLPDLEYRWMINRTETLPDGHTPDLTIALLLIRRMK